MKSRPLHIGDDDRGRPQYLERSERTMGLQMIGAPGTGKSQGLNHCVEQDERYLPGALVTIDTAGNHPDSIYAQARCRALRYRPMRPTYFINLSKPKYTYGFRMFARRPGADLSTAVQKCTRRLFTAWRQPDLFERPRLLYWSTGVFATGLHHGDIGLAELRLLLDHEQAAVRTHLTSGTPVASRWRSLNQKRHDQFDEQIEAIRNRLDPLVAAAGPRRFLSLVHHEPALLDFRRIIAERARVHFNLQESDDLDRDHADMIGALVAAEAVDQACQRPDPDSAPVALYIDEAHRFVGPDLAMAFVEGRKFSIYTTIAHQYLDQLREEQNDKILKAVLSCARTKMVFGLGSDADAKELVHEIFVGPHGINYTEVKYTHTQTKFRPVADRDTSTSRTQGQGTAKSRRKSVSESAGEDHSTGHSHSRNEGHDWGHSDTTTVTHGSVVTKGTNRAVGATHSDGRSASVSVADGTSEVDTESVNHTRGWALTDGHSIHRGHTGGTTQTRSTTTVAAPDGTLMHTETESVTTPDGWTDGEGFSTAQTLSGSDTEGSSRSVGRNHLRTRSDGQTEGDATTRTQGESESEGHNDSEGDSETDSERWSQGDTDTHSASKSTSKSKSRGRDNAHTESKTCSDSVSDVPVTRHEEFQEASVEFFTLEEHRQRLADRLRLPPQRGYTLRRNDCRNAQLFIPVLKLLRYTERAQLGVEAQCATKTGAIECEKADAIIAENLRNLLGQAQKVAATNEGRVHFGDDSDVEPRVAARLKRRLTKKPAPEGQGGPQG